MLAQLRNWVVGVVQLREWSNSSEIVTFSSILNNHRSLSH